MSWMDEGLTQYDVAQGMKLIYGAPRSGGRPNDSEEGQRQQYLLFARAGADNSLMVNGDELSAGSLHAQLQQDGAGAGGTPEHHGTGPLPRCAGCLRPRVDRPTSGAVRLLQCDEPRGGEGPVVVLADLVLSRLAARSGDRRAWPRGRLDHDHGGGSGPGADAGAASGHPCRRFGGEHRVAREGVAGWLAARDRHGGGSRSPVTRVEIDAAGDFPDIDRSNQVWPR